MNTNEFCETNVILLVCPKTYLHSYMDNFVHLVKELIRYCFCSFLRCQLTKPILEIIRRLIFTFII